MNELRQTIVNIPKAAYRKGQNDKESTTLKGTRMRENIARAAS